MKYHVVLKINTIIDREVEADTEDDIYDAIDEMRSAWDLNDVLVDMEEITEAYIYENGTQRQIW